MGVGGQRHAPVSFTPGKDRVPIAQEAGRAPGLVWIGAENVAHTGIRSPDCPARSESLYQLHYPGSSVFFGNDCNSSIHLVKCRLQNVKSQYQYVYWKVLTPELLELGDIFLIS
jgi:hypothetical protein